MPKKNEIMVVHVGPNGTNITGKTKKGRELISLTHMAKDHGTKLVADYLRLESTKEYLQEVESDMGIPISELIQVVRGGLPENQGTWAVGVIAQHFAIWLSAKYALFVTKLLEALRTGEAKVVSMLPPIEAQLFREVSIEMSKQYNKKLCEESVTPKQKKFSAINGNKKAMRLATNGLHDPSDIRRIATSLGIKHTSGVDALHQLAPVRSAWMGDAKAVFVVGISKTIEDAFKITAIEIPYLEQLQKAGLSKETLEYFRYRKSLLGSDEEK